VTELADTGSEAMSVLKIIYILTCFISGAIVMIIELSGIRLLAPIFGSSLFTWTALIGVVLICISIGGFIGGYLADRTIKPVVVIWVLVVSASFIVLIPPLHAVSAELASGFGIVYGPTFLSILLFIVPGVMLGIVNPYVTRLLAKIDNDSRIGAATGYSNAASALGSFLGTYLAGYYLVPNLDIRDVFVLCAFVLVMLAIAVFLYSGVHVGKKQAVGYGAMLVASLSLTFTLKMGYGPGVIHVTNSKYQQIMVYEAKRVGETVRYMINNGQPQGAINLVSKESPYEFQNYWKLITQYKNDIGSALAIGGGTFTVPQKILERYPDAKVTVVEIDDDVVTTARKYFNLNDYPDLNVVASDARWFSNNDTSVYDFVFVDAYTGSYSIPSHLVTVEYFQTLKSRMAHDGIVMMNVIGNEEGHMSDVFLAIYKTFTSVFGEIHVYKTPHEEGQQASNLILLASEGGVMPNVKYDVGAEVMEYNSTKLPGDVFKLSESPLLTDNRNPLDSIVSQMLIEMKL